jgi:hypothetical protein
MFEQEIELEKRESSVIPLLMIVTLIVCVVGVAGYYVWKNKQVLGSAEAGNVISQSLRSQGPAVVRFHTGLVKAAVNEKPEDPHYRLLEKAGLLKRGKGNGRIFPIALTAQGQKLLADIADVKKTKEADNSELYVVPLAERRLVTISKVTMVNPDRATVEFEWKWEPNKLGNLFDASGSLVKSFNTWDRSTLIDKYGAAFYHGDPAKVVVALAKTDGRWQIAIE